MSLTKPIRQPGLAKALASILGAPGAAKPIAHEPSSAPGSAGRLLVVEDNPVNQKVTTGMLRSLGYAVELAQNGREALAALEQASYDVILMDCQMPEMDGFEATRLIRSREAERGEARRIIIAMTAHALSGDREECLFAGMDDYLSKPFRLRDLDTVISRWRKPTPEPSPSGGGDAD